VLALVLALALAAQPWSVLAAVLLVTAEHGMAKEVAFVVGWVAALAAVAALAVALHPDQPRTMSTTPALAWLEVGAGAVLVGWGLLRRSAPRPAAEPRWLGRLDRLPPVLALALGAFLPTYAFVVAAVGSMMRGGLEGAGLVLAVAGFVALASAGVAAPLLVLVRGRDRAELVYAGWRRWLTDHASLMLRLVGGLLGLALVVNGVVGLIGTAR
jgi:hypothetical protein